MTFTVSVASVVAVASAIVTVYGAIKVIAEMKKKAEQPMADVNKKLDRDKKRLDKLEDSFDDLKKDNEITLTALKVIINHLRTDNNTGAMQKLEEEIDSYLIRR